MQEFRLPNHTLEPTQIVVLKQDDGGVEIDSQTPRTDTNSCIETAVSLYLFEILHHLEPTQIVVLKQTNTWGHNKSKKPRTDTNSCIETSPAPLRTALCVDSNRHK